MQNAQITVQFIEKRLNSCLQQLKIAKTNVETFKNIKLNMGPKVKELEKAVKSLGVNIMAYHSHSFIGNHCLTLIQKTTKTVVDKKTGIPSVNEIDGPAKLTAPIAEQPEMQRKLYNLLSQFGKIFPLIIAARFLKKNEINELKHLCSLLGEQYFQDFGEETMTLKMHMLIYEVPKVAEEFGTLGVSEEGVESSHAYINKIDHQFCTINDSLRHQDLVVKNHQL